MKERDRFLRKLHSLPDGIKQMLVGLCMITAVVILVSGWNTNISSRLGRLSQNPTSPEEVSTLTTPPLSAYSNPRDSNTSLPSPLAGIKESLKGLEWLLPKNAVRLENTRPTPPANLFTKIKEKAKQTPEAINRLLRETWSKIHPTIP